jgi:hypothetical protein
MRSSAAARRKRKRVSSLAATNAMVRWAVRQHHRAAVGGR